MPVKMCQAPFCQAKATFKVRYAKNDPEWYCTIHTGYMISSYSGTTITNIERLQEPIREVCMKIECDKTPEYSITRKGALGLFHGCEEHAFEYVRNYYMDDFMKMEPYRANT